MAGQGAGNNRGQGAGNGRFVKFTHGAAQRIAKAVRVVEGGDRNQPGITFDHPTPLANAKLFRIGTFTGAWPIGSSKTVTFKYQANTPNTASALNLFFPIASTASQSRDCAIAKDGTAWYLIDIPMQTATAVFVGSTQSGVAVLATTSMSLLTNTATCVIVTQTSSRQIVSGSSQYTLQCVSDVDVSAVLNTSTCGITVSKTVTRDTFTFEVAGGTSTAAVIAASTTGLFASSTATAAVITQTATAVFARQTFTASFVTFTY